MERLTYTVEEAGQLLGISRNTAYVCAREGIIPTIKMAKRLLVPRIALERMLAEAGQQKEPPKPRDDKAA